MNREQRRRFYKKYPQMRKMMRKSSQDAVIGLETALLKKWNKELNVSQEDEANGSENEQC